MKAVYLRNFRKGPATNSSSTHSVIYKKEEDMLNDLNIFEENFYDRYTNTIAASKEAKIKYIAANIHYNKELFEVMCKIYPQMKEYIPLIEEQESTGDDLLFGMYSRGELYTDNPMLSINYLSYIIDNNDIVIVGGSDEMDFIYDTTDNHKNIDLVGKNYIKNGNYYVGYDYCGNRVRVSLHRDKLIPEYPELIDLKITNRCRNSCNFCYTNSTSDGEHADLYFIESILSGLPRTEFAIGGGNILLYPYLKDLFKFLKKQGHIINTTLHSFDARTLITNPELHQLFKTYVNGIGISVQSKYDIERIVGINQMYSNIVIHIIPELLGVDKTVQLIEECHKTGLYSILFLGYKQLGRASNTTCKTFTNEELNKICLHYFSVDTLFANRYYNYLKNNYDVDKTICLQEGEFSMYIDAVDKKAYKSSYQLDKPYNLKKGNWDELNKSWYHVKQAFKNIRNE